MDIEHIKSLVELMVENDLSRLELREGETQILLRRGHPPVISTPAVGPIASAAPTGAAPPVEPAVPPSPAAAPPAEAEELFIRSPMVGTFYAAPDPESPPFIKVGDPVNSETVVCLVEAMKVFNEIKAEVAGRVMRVLVNNAEAVEFDQPLFVVAPA
ncbi:MAG TPA: acetyl-CoA carboxylase biotin carboxyl carrier protein [Phycisphaerae bacterium]|nr:acetyl-CoA carboxylase biotin carboxyl carrier protein [Phycisphaerae bacterium]